MIFSPTPPRRYIYLQHNFTGVSLVRFGHIIDEQVTISEGSIEELYDKCKKWLIGKQGFFTMETVNITDENKPTRLVAYHQKHRQGAPVGYKKFENKIITIHLSETVEGVLLRFTLDHPNPRILNNPKLTSVYWGYLLESLWKHLGLTPNKELLRCIYPKEHLGLDTTVLFPFLLGVLLLMYCVGIFLLQKTPLWQF